MWIVVAVCDNRSKLLKSHLNSSSTATSITAVELQLSFHMLIWYDIIDHLDLMFSPHFEKKCLGANTAQYVPKQYRHIVALALED